MRIGNEWRAIRRWSISPGVNTEHATLFFAELTCPVCVAERRFDNSGKRRFRVRKMKRNGPASFTFAQSVNELKTRIEVEWKRSYCPSSNRWLTRMRNRCRLVSNDIDAFAEIVSKSKKPAGTNALAGFLK